MFTFLGVLQLTEKKLETFVQVCCWSSADKRYSNYIWMINNFIAYKGAAYIRCLTIYITVRNTK